MCCKTYRSHLFKRFLMLTPSPPPLPNTARDNTLVIGSSVFFHVPNDPNLHMEMAGGVEAWAGYRQAVKPCQFGLSFNIDLAATAFLTSGPMVNVLSKVRGLWGGRGGGRGRGGAAGGRGCRAGGRGAWQGGG
jgi:hypothetical protein